MVTDYPQVLVGTQPTTRIGFGAGVVRGLRRVGQMICGLRGHDHVRHYERNRFALECTACGHVSQGWTVSETKPQLRYAGDPGRHQLRSRVQVRRVA